MSDRTVRDYWGKISYHITVHNGLAFTRKGPFYRMRTSSFLCMKYLITDDKINYLGSNLGPQNVEATSYFIPYTEVLYRFNYTFLR